MGSGGSAEVKFEPTGLEFATTSGKGIRCCWKEGMNGILDHSWPAPCAESFVKKLLLEVPFRK